MMGKNGRSKSGKGGKGWYNNKKKSTSVSGGSSYKAPTEGLEDVVFKRGKIADAAGYVERIEKIS